jgi:hypothetical protein
MSISEATVFVLEHPVTGRWLLFKDAVIGLLILLSIDLGKP